MRPPITILSIMSGQRVVREYQERTWQGLEGHRAVREYRDRAAALAKRRRWAGVQRDHLDHLELWLKGVEAALKYPNDPCVESVVAGLARPFVHTSSSCAARRLPTRPSRRAGCGPRPPRRRGRPTMMTATAVVRPLLLSWCCCCDRCLSLSFTASCRATAVAITASHRLSSPLVVALPLAAEEGQHFALYLFVHTKHSHKAGPISVARLKIDLPFQNRLVHSRVHRRSASPLCAAWARRDSATVSQAGMKRARSEKRERERR